MAFPPYTDPSVFSAPLPPSIWEYVVIRVRPLIGWLVAHTVNAKQPYVQTQCHRSETINNYTSYFSVWGSPRIFTASSSKTERWISTRSRVAGRRCHCGPWHVPGLLIRVHTPTRRNPTHNSFWSPFHVRGSRWASICFKVT